MAKRMKYCSTMLLDKC